MKLAIQLVTYEAADFLPALFASLKVQTFTDWELFVLDNSSSKVREQVRRAIEDADFSRPVHLVESPSNIGFAGGHQALYEGHEAPYVLLVNPDLILGADYIETVLHELEAREDAASAMGIVKRIESPEDDLAAAEEIDTIGLRQLSTGGVVDVRTDVPNAITQIFGVPGCVALYKRSALQQAKDGERLFDPEYFVYKEDVELAYRVRALGYKAYLIPSATCYHRRTLRSSRRSEGVSRTTRYYSYRNHLWNIYTYYSVRDLLKDAWALVPYELAKLAFTFVIDPTILLDAIRSSIKHADFLTQKRHVYTK